MSLDGPAIGIHIGTDRGFAEAVASAKALGVESVQIFTTNPSSWQAKMADATTARAFTNSLRAEGVRTIVSHANYLINLAGTEEPIYAKSRKALVGELERGAAYGLDHVIVHIGSHKGAGLEAGYEHVESAVHAALEAVPPIGSPRLLLENSAGTGDNVGGTFEDLAELMGRLDDVRDRVGVCFDTCHAHAAGYEMSGAEMTGDVIAELDEVLGLDRLFVIHANDTQVPAGAKADRHWHIGEGLLGADAFAYMLNHPQLRDLPFILETPGDEHIEGKRNLETMRALL